MPKTSDLTRVAKAELHLHLEGSIQPATLLALALKNRVPLPAADEAGLRAWFRYQDFRHFIAVYLAITSCLRSAPDYELVVVDMARELSRQGVRYAEVTVTPGTARDLGVPFDALLRGLVAGRARAREELGVELAWIFDIVRNLPEQRRLAHADFTLRAALEGRSEGVIALGLGGLEHGHPPEPFAPWFERARAEGLHSVPHAGETAGPESIWGALRTLHAERIGHGVRAIEDPDLVEHLARSGIPLEICPTSNLRLNVYPDIASHPLPRLLAAGVRVTVGSDDPPLFNTTLAAEIELLGAGFGLGTAEVHQILLEGARASFLSADRRDRLEAEIRAGIEAAP